MSLASSLIRLQVVSYLYGAIVLVEKVFHKTHHTCDEEFNLVTGNVECRGKHDVIAALSVNHSGARVDKDSVFSGQA